jgi:hypothetical protein
MNIRLVAGALRQTPLTHMRTVPPPDMLAKMTRRKYWISKSNSALPV